MPEAFFCGAKVPSDQDLRQVRNFAKFLQGKGSRCPQCLHKAAKHKTRCEAKDCDCPLDWSGVHAVRDQVSAPERGNPEDLCMCGIELKFHTGWDDHQFVSANEYYRGERA